MKQFRDVLFNKVTRNAIIYSLLLLLVYRLGAYIATPGIDKSVLESFVSNNSDLTSFFDFFGGGNIQQMAIFALGVSPYITASIIIQLLETDLVPSISEWKHQGVDGQNKRHTWTKRLAIIIAIVQSLGIAVGYYFSSGSSIVENNSYLIVTLIMTAGTAILVWLSNRITEKGVGNGLSFLIVAGILASVPSQLGSITSSFTGKEGEEFFKEYILWSIIFVITIIVIIMVVYYSLAYRKIFVNYVRNNKGTLRQNSYLPIKLNPAGVIPVIFASPFMLIMRIIVDYLYNTVPSLVNNGVGIWEEIIKSIFGSGPYWGIYITVYGLIVLVFSIFYSYVQLNPETMAENLEKQSAYVVGVRPGEDTLNYLANIIGKTSFWGGIILTFLAILPILIEKTTSITFDLSLMGTGLLIVVSVLVQIYQSLINKVESNKYRILLGDK